MKTGARLWCSVALGAALGCAPGMKRGTIRVVVEDSVDSERMENAVVLLQCSCLAAMKELFTGRRGIYSFDDLPPGNYTVQVLVGRANESETVRLSEGAKSRVDFSVDPQHECRLTQFVLPPEPEPPFVSKTAKWPDWPTPATNCVVHSHDMPIAFRSTVGNSLRDAKDACAH